jgi:hypothetical protein
MKLKGFWLDGENSEQQAVSSGQLKAKAQCGLSRPLLTAHCPLPAAYCLLLSGGSVPKTSR